MIPIRYVIYNTFHPRVLTCLSFTGDVLCCLLEMNNNRVREGCKGRFVKKRKEERKGERTTSLALCASTVPPAPNPAPQTSLYIALATTGSAVSAARHIVRRSKETHRRCNALKRIKKEGMSERCEGMESDVESMCPIIISRRRRLSIQPSSLLAV
jgi:hypothetical protein